jgi:hypothetical protein
MRGILVVLALAAGAVPADAQTTWPSQSGPRPSGVEFLPRFDFLVSMEHLFSEERRFVWDANFGGDLDIVDYGGGRLTFVANYQTILGSEFRAFDPNQGNYTLEGAASARAGAFELAGVFHHVSRHLSDRPKRHPIDWNMIGGRIRGGGVRGRTELQARADVRGGGRRCRCARGAPAQARGGGHGRSPGARCRRHSGSRDPARLSRRGRHAD